MKITKVDRYIFFDFIFSFSLTLSSHPASVKGLGGVTVNGAGFPDHKVTFLFEFSLFNFL